MTGTPCAPQPVPLAITDPCAMLPLLRGALYQLMSGQAKAEVRFGDQWLRWHAGNVKELRAEIRRLETVCAADGMGGYVESNAPRAVRAGPYVPVGVPRGWR